MYLYDRLCYFTYFCGWNIVKGKRIQEGVYSHVASPVTITVSRIFSGTNKSRTGDSISSHLQIISDHISLIMKTLKGSSQNNARMSNSKSSANSSSSNSIMERTNDETLP